MCVIVILHIGRGGAFPPPPQELRPTLNLTRPACTHESFELKLMMQVRKHGTFAELAVLNRMKGW
jgi:hypothetical protein